MEYYVYKYLREDLTPYYIGKGKNSRAYQSHKRSNGAELRPSKDFIKLVKINLSEQEAWDLEIELISYYGLKSEGGILVNMKAGGEGGTPSQELRDHWSKVKKGIPKPPRTKQHTENQAATTRNKPNLKTSQRLKERHATSPDRSETIAKQSAGVKEWYNTIDKEAKAWNTWHTRFEQDYSEYARAIILLQQYPIAKVEKQVKFQKHTLRKLKDQAHGVYKHFPELLQS
jgi:hypothetical protein